MKKLLIVSLIMLTFGFSANADWFSTNVGSRTGKFVKTTSPNYSTMPIVVAAKPATTDVEAGSFVLYVSSTSSTCSLNFICKDVSGNIVSGNIK